MGKTVGFTRRTFLRGTAAAGSAAILGSRASAAPADVSRKRIRVGVIGCGSVSKKYLPHLRECPFVELVSVCDILVARARQTAARFQIPHCYPHIEKMLPGAPFDLLVNLTDMQEHGRLNRQALEAGKHVWSEKPMADHFAQGQELLDLAKRKGLCLWAAPVVVASPQFAIMARTLREGQLGQVAAAHASYGHLGPNWASFFYEKGGGSLPDLGVYNLTTLTGLFGPARAVTAMLSVVTPTRHIRGKGTIAVEAEDNAMVILDHGNNILSQIQCGFNYFAAREHDHTSADHHTISIIGTGGSMHLAGYDWAPHGVDLATREQPALKRYAADSGSYCWQQGASHMAECLATGKQSPLAPEHALHVIEIIDAARASQRTGRRVAVASRFPWPLPANLDPP